VLLDFGLAILSDEERRTSRQQAGAIEFMAPEQNDGQLFFETDVYSFGIVLFELLAGKVPFPLGGNSVTARNKVMLAHLENEPPDLLSLRASTLPAAWSDEKKAAEMQVPEWLLSTIYKCLQKVPEDRFANGTALVNYILHHKIYAAENVGLVGKEDDKWQSVVAQKDDELQNLKAIVARQDKELKTLREKEPVVAEEYMKRKAVPKSVLNAVLLALIVVGGGLTIYGLFFRHAVVESVSIPQDSHMVRDTLHSNAEQGMTTIASENNSSAKKPAATEQKSQVTVSAKASQKTSRKITALPARAVPENAGIKEVELFSNGKNNN
jgi:serine/threonine-protein kinase